MLAVARPSPGGDRPRPARARDRARAGQAVRRAARLQQPRRHPRSRRTATRRRIELHRRGDRARAQGRQPAMGVDAARPDLRRLRARQVGRGARAVGRADRARRSPTRGSGSRRCIDRGRRPSTSIGESSRGGRGRSSARSSELESSADVQERARLRERQGAACCSRRGNADGGAGGRRARGSTMRDARRARRRVHEGALRRSRSRPRFELERPSRRSRTCSRSSRALPPGRSSQVFQAQASRFRARLAAERGEADEAERLFKRAAGLFREIAAPFYLAVTQLEHAEWLVAQGRAAEARAAARRGARGLRAAEAQPWLERCDAVIAGGARVHAEAT